MARPIGHPQDNHEFSRLDVGGRALGELCLKSLRKLRLPGLSAHSQQQSKLPSR